MSFTHPQALWLLALAVPVILFHFYRGRIRRLRVPSLLFWDQMVAEDERQSAINKLRHWLTLILALIALTLLATALADPSVRGWTPEARPVAIVIDTAPEMAARDADGRPRLSSARDRARAFAEGLYRLAPVALYDAGGLVEAFSTDRANLARWLGRLPRDVAAKPIADVVAAVRDGHRDATIVVFTARPCPAADERVIVAPVGTPRGNRSLLDARVSDGEVTALAVNASDEEAEATLVVRDRGRVVVERPLKLAARASERIAWRPEKAERLAQGAFLELALAPEDAFPLDDSVHVIVPPAVSPPVVVVARGDPDAHLLAALKALDPRVRVIAPGQVAAVQDEGGAPVWVFDRVDPPATFDGSALLVACGPMGAAVENPRLADWDRRAPVHDLVDYADVAVRRARVLQGEPLVLSDRGPVAVVERAMGRARIQFGFAFGVSESDFALHPSFPIFVRNAIVWLGGEGRRAFPREAFVGDVIVSRGSLPEGVVEATVTTVRGEGTGPEEPVYVERGAVRFQVREPGLVKVTVGPRTEWIAARLRASPDLEKLPAAAGALPERLSWWRNLPYAVVAGALVLAILVLEWWLFQTRG